MQGGIEDGMSQYNVTPWTPMTSTRTGKNTTTTPFAMPTPHNNRFVTNSNNSNNNNNNQQIVNNYGNLTLNILQSNSKNSKNNNNNNNNNNNAMTNNKDPSAINQLQSAHSFKNLLTPYPQTSISNRDGLPRSGSSLRSPSPGDALIQGVNSNSGVGSGGGGGVGGGGMSSLVSPTLDFTNIETRQRQISKDDTYDPIRDDVNQKLSPMGRFRTFSDCLDLALSDKQLKEQAKKKLQFKYGNATQINLQGQQKRKKQKNKQIKGLTKSYAMHGETHTIRVLNLSI